MRDFCGNKKKNIPGETGLSLKWVYCERVEGKRRQKKEGISESNLNMPNYMRADLVVA